MLLLDLVLQLLQQLCVCDRSCQICHCHLNYDIHARETR